LMQSCHLGTSSCRNPDRATLDTRSRGAPVATELLRCTRPSPQREAVLASDERLNPAAVSASGSPVGEPVSRPLADRLA
jgi:hypothetical protein